MSCFHRTQIGVSIVRENVDPFPGSLIISIYFPFLGQHTWDDQSRPVPPNFRVVRESAWENALKSLLLFVVNANSCIPYRDVEFSCVLILFVKVIFSSTSPEWLNFTTLLRRLIRILFLTWLDRLLQNVVNCLEYSTGAQGPFLKRIGIYDNIGCLFKYFDNISLNTIKLHFPEPRF